ncbi:Hsp70 family protein [Virgisporangium aurantiacum]|uniref:Hsp70 family protein n=1 Tax=Virgisporangium aurantiacum TaxID=175570 RepID=UPI00194FB966|nr:Hsp70 family protein [Virgisporangium aurantiacum]
MSDGFSIGIDLGTSNTVAVLRWPDGRTRPLLFDGQPLLPSCVQLDGTGRLHVGRDAQRLAQVDPGRFEPNPKRLIDESMTLLGDREVPVVDLLAAVLGAVASATVQACGFLPPAVLTYPAAWGAARRDVLREAARRAGWASHNAPGIDLLPEPVAATRYFTDVLRRPVPVSTCLAVFDFGGGTLDVAVVRNDGAAFSVVSSGGLPDLGGLDLDAAVVTYLCDLVGRRSPAAVGALTTPGTAVERRQRRAFWDDVRGAREMLSRTTVAPVSVPGVDEAVHLTRDELEKLAGPLLQRAVEEAGFVIRGAGLQPNQLSGLFMVGGASRTPLAARLLHARLGIAPTVLEQPELPVAEGALMERRAAVPVPAAAVSPAGPPDQPPLPGAESPPSFGPPPARRVWWRRRVTWVVAAATAVVVAAGAVLTWMLYDPYSFGSLSAVGEGWSVPSGAGTERPGPGIGVENAYVMYKVGDRTHVVAVNLRTGNPKWDVEVPGDPGSGAWVGGRAGGAVVRTTGATSSDAHTLFFLDADDGGRRWEWSLDSGDGVYVYSDYLLVTRGKLDALRKIDYSTGKQAWEALYPDGTRLLTVDNPDFTAAERIADRIVLVAGDGTATSYNSTSGKPISSRGKAVGADDIVHAHGDRLYVASAGDGYQITAYDLTSMGRPDLVYDEETARHVVDFTRCGEDLCVVDGTGSGGAAKEQRLVRIDVGKRERRWTKPVDGAKWISAIGESVLVTSSGSGTFGSKMFTADGTVAFADDARGGHRIDDRGALFWPWGSNEAAPITGVTDKGDHTELATVAIRSGECDADERYVVCGGEKAVKVYRFTR